MKLTSHTYTEQDIAQIKEWIVALRSGNYKQGHKRLESIIEHYCCLGLGCMLFIPESNLMRGPSNRLEGALASYQFYSPRWLSLINEDLYQECGVSLTMLNDGTPFSYMYKVVKPHTFSEIADILELFFVYKIKLEGDFYKVHSIVTNLLKHAKEDNPNLEG